MTEKERRDAFAAERRALDAREEWAADRDRTAGWAAERLADDTIDSRCENCGREVDRADEQCPACHRQHLAEIERDDD